MKGNLDLLLSQCLGPCVLCQMSATTHGIHYMHMQQTFTFGFLFSFSFLFYLLLLPYENENKKDKYIFLCSLLLGAVFMHDAVQLLICKSSPSLCGTRCGTAFFR